MRPGAVSDAVDLYKGTLGLGQAKEHLEAEALGHIRSLFVRFQGGLHKIRGPLASVKERFRKELSLDMSMQDFSILNFSLRRINSQRLAKLARIYLEFAKTNIFILIAPPAGLKLDLTNINGALFRARQYSLKAISVLKAMIRRNKLD